VVILLLAAIWAPPPSPAAKAGDDVTNGADRRPMERRAVAAAPIRSWSGFLDACNWDDDEKGADVRTEVAGEKADAPPMRQAMLIEGRARTMVVFVGRWLVVE